MSSYLTHLFAYLLAAVTLTFILVHYELVSAGYSLFLASMAVGCLYTLLPDIDMPSSRARRMLGKTMLGAALVCLLGFLADVFDRRALYVAVGLNLFLYVLWYVKHRGILHTPLVGAVFSAPLYLLNPLLAAYAFVGFLTHLVLDGEVFR